MRRLHVVIFVFGFFHFCHGRRLVSPQTRPSRSVFFELEENEGTGNCSTSGGRPGTCLDVESCLSRFLDKRIDLSTLQSSQCPSTWMVCCPRVKTRPVATTTTTSTTSKPETDNYKQCGYSTIPNIRVVGGSMASEGAWPWLALLVYRTFDNVTYPACGGSLISDQFVLTAAHCLRSGKDVTLVQVRLGEHNYSAVSSVVQEFEPAEIIVHEDYKTFRRGNDIALIKLNRKVVFTEIVRTICLPFDLSHVDDNTFVAGWGRTTQDGRGSDVLQQAKVPIVAESRCRNAYQNYTSVSFNNTICAGGDGKTDSCRGDSGGPLMWPDSVGRFYAIGVVSWGHGCALEGYPGIYTNVRDFLKWIEHNVKEKSE